MGLLQRSFTESDMVNVVLHDGYRRRIGYALALPPDDGSVVVYEENAIDPVDTIQSPASADLTVTLFASRSLSPNALVVATGSAAAPPWGYVVHFPVGAGEWTLIVQATRPLSGSFANAVPWLLLAGGLISAVLAAAVLEVVLRRRDFAMSLVSERTRELRASLRDLEETQAELHHQAFHDALTKLPNRALLINRLEQALARAKRTSTGNAIVFLDLDRFKWINDSLGHRVGDRLIAAVADRFRDAVRPGDTVARLGGDEFVVLCEDLVEQSGATTVAQRMAESLVVPFDIDGHSIELTASFGVSFSDSSTDAPLDMVRDADLAMYRAKDRGRNRIEMYEPAMRAHADARLATEGALRLAIERHELTVHYQPVVRLFDAAVVGVEALVRWQDERQEFTLPGKFVALAEETGLILPLGLQVLTAACDQAAAWIRQYPEREEFSVSVNLSGRQLENPGLAEEVDAALSASGLKPDRLWLEVTESVLLDESGPSFSTLHTLKEVGVTLVVDDFGTGYSSLLYVRRLPVDVLKIDQSFVAGLGRQRADDTIVSTVIDLAHSLGLTAVAEGVETAEQAKRLAVLRCELAQGFYWSPPTDASTVMSWIDTASPSGAIVGHIPLGAWR